MNLSWQSKVGWEYHLKSDISDDQSHLKSAPDQSVVINFILLSQATLLVSVQGIIKGDIEVEA